MRQPLSPAQEAIWYEEQLLPDSCNSGSVSVTLTGEVPATLIERACLAVVDRHPTLRALVRRDERRLELEVLPARDAFSFTREDAPCPEGSEAALLRDWRSAHPPSAWDLTTRPPIAFHLLDHGPRRQTLEIPVHHLCFDGRSKFLLARDFVGALGELLAGGTPSSTVLPYPEARWTEGEDVLREVRDYWDRLGLHDLGPLRLPRQEGPGTGTRVGATERFEITLDDRERLRALASAEGTTLFGGLLACLAAQFGAYGNRAAVIAVPADTTSPETREVIGLAVNVVPVGIAVDPGASFRSLLGSARESLGYLRQFRYVPFQRVLQQARRGKGVHGGARGAFTTLSVTMPKVPEGIPGLPGVGLRWDFFTPNSSQAFDLMLQIRDEPRAFYGRADYARRFIDEAHARKFVTHLAHTVHAVLQEPDQPLSRVEVLPEEARRAPARKVPATRRRAEDAVHLEAEALQRLAEQVVDGHEPGPLVEVVTPVRKFRGTAEVRELVRRGVRVRVEYRDPEGRLVASGLVDEACLSVGGEPVLVDMAPGFRLRVLDATGRDLPVDVPGRLAIERDTGEAPPTLLLTEDRGWRGADGGIRYLGRRDEEVFWSGLVADPSRLERRLCAQPGVRDAEVTLTSGEQGVTVLASVTPRPGARLDPMAVKHRLREQLRADELRPSKLVVRDPSSTQDSKEAQT
jgi:Condensation domain